MYIFQVVVWVEQDAVDLTSISNIQDEKIMTEKEKGIVWKESVMISTDVIIAAKEKDANGQDHVVQSFVIGPEAEVENVKNVNDDVQKKSMNEEIHDEIVNEKKNANETNDPDQEKRGNVINETNHVINVIKSAKNANQNMVTLKSKKSLLMTVCYSVVFFSISYSVFECRFIYQFEFYIDASYYLDDLTKNMFFVLLTLAKIFKLA